MNKHHSSGFYTDELTGEQIEERCNCSQCQAARNLEKIARRNAGLTGARE